MSIKNSKIRELNLDSELTYLSMVLYASKNNLKLGYTLEDVSNILKYFKTNAENGVRLYKILNKNVYQKN